MTLVLDASMALAWIFERDTELERERADRALSVLAIAPACVPSLWQTELANALLVGERRKLLTTVQSADYLARIDKLPIQIDQAGNRDRVMDVARQYGLTAYDASYLELALRLGASLATFDRKLAGAMALAGGVVFE